MVNNNQQMLLKKIQELENMVQYLEEKVRKYQVLNESLIEVMNNLDNND